MLWTRYKISFHFLKGKKVIYQGNITGGISSDNLKGVHSRALQQVTESYADHPEAAGATALSINVRKIDD